MITSRTDGFAQTCRDGCYFSNTYHGVDAFPSEMFGESNTALGYLTLNADPELSFYTQDTAIGALALSPGSDRSDTGSSNTAIGANAIEYPNLGYGGGHKNVAVGTGALSGCGASYLNTVLGANALYYGTGIFDASVEDTAIGAYALYNNLLGDVNTAIGMSALFNSQGGYNSANGYHALYNNSSGGSNLTEGNLALSNNTTGTSNIAIGDSAGINLTTGSNNIDIGNKGIAGEAKTIRLGKKGTQTATYIAGIRGKTVAGGVGVLIDSNGRLGTVNSSARYKEAIQPMDKASEAILSLRPVTFRYKHELDPESIPQFGLVAEEVARVNPDLVACDYEGKPFTVRYEAVNAMLLNEFIEQHRQGDERGAEINQLTLSDSNQTKLLRAEGEEIAALKETMKKQAARIRKVTALIAADRPVPRLVINHQ